MNVKYIKTSNMMLLPPPKDHCQECAVKHEPNFPHDKDSLFYQTKFNMTYGRSATWRDAMTHCSDEMKNDWIEALEKRGVVI